MPKYLSLMKFTQKGIENIKEIPEQIKKSAEMIEELGGKVIGVYAIMGEYDLVGIAEAPSDEIALKFLMALGSAGNVRTTTYKIFDLDKMEGII